MLLMSQNYNQDPKILWYLIQSCYNSISSDNYLFRKIESLGSGFILSENINIESHDNWYRVDVISGENSISLTIEKEYSLTESKSKYVIKLMKNGQSYRQTQQELIWKVINSEIVPNLRNIILEEIVSDI